MDNRAEWFLHHFAEKFFQMLGEHAYFWDLPQGAGQLHVKEVSKLPFVHVSV